VAKAEDWPTGGFDSYSCLCHSLPSVTLGKLLHLYLSFPICKVGVIMLLYLAGGEERVQGWYLSCNVLYKPWLGGAAE